MVVGEEVGGELEGLEVWEQFEESTKTGEGQGGRGVFCQCQMADGGTGK